MNSEPLKRRWYQFSLRTLLVVMAILVTSLGLLRWYIDSRRQITRAQVVIAERLEQQGAEIIWEPADPEWIRQVFGEQDFRNVVSVTWLAIPGDDPNDALADLRHFGQLRTLVLNNRAISDAGLTHLQNLEHLEELSLPLFCGVKVDGLRSLPHLRQLHLWTPLGGYASSWNAAIEDVRITIFSESLPNCHVSAGSIGVWKLERLGK